MSLNINVANSSVEVPKNTDANIDFSIEEKGEGLQVTDSRQIEKQDNRYISFIKVNNWEKIEKIDIELR